MTSSAPHPTSDNEGSREQSGGWHRQSDTTGTVVFYFDGTLSIGDGPVRSYARHADAHLTSEFRSEAEDTLDKYLSGTIPTATKEARGWQDGYDVVAGFCRGRMPAQRLQEAYLASRVDLAIGVAKVGVPAGMKDFLRELGSLGCRRVLLSNSPITGLRETLKRCGAADGIDEVVPNVRKPDRWPDARANLRRAR